MLAVYSTKILSKLKKYINSLTKISTYIFQHLLPFNIHNCPRSKALLDLYAEARLFAISLAKSSPPRPSKSGVAFAEQSTKNSILPSFGLSDAGMSISSFTATNTSVLASLNLAEPKACDTIFVSSSMGR